MKCGVIPVTTLGSFPSGAESTIRIPPLQVFFHPALMDSWISIPRRIVSTFGGILQVQVANDHDLSTSLDHSDDFRWQRLGAPQSFSTWCQAWILKAQTVVWLGGNHLRVSGYDNIMTHVNHVMTIDPGLTLSGRDGSDGSRPVWRSPGSMPKSLGGRWPHWMPQKLMDFVGHRRNRWSNRLR